MRIDGSSPQTKLYSRTFVLEPIPGNTEGHLYIFNDIFRMV